jgi:hypothetical protein
MDSPNQTFPRQWTPSPSPARSVRRPWGYIGAALVLGIIVGAIPFLLIFLLGGGDRPALSSSPSSGKEAVVVQLSKTFLTQLIQKKADFTGVPGTVSNIQITTMQPNSITVTADDQMSVLGIGTTKQFTLVLQPVVSNCAMRMHVLHADLQGVPVTNIAASFEEQINQQLSQSNSALPAGFTYCAIRVRTEAQALIVSYSATPQ